MPRNRSPRERPFPGYLPFVLALGGLTGTSIPRQSPIDSPRFGRHTVGDTIRVRVESGGLWGDTVRTTEEIRIGSLDGPNETTLSMVSGVAVSRSLDVAVFDEVQHSLLVFDSTGQSFRRLGREGAGPGEYRTNSGIAFARDGAILQVDPGNLRINRFDPDGKPLDAFRINQSLRTWRALLLDSLGRAYVRAWVQGRNGGVFGYSVYEIDGRLKETILPPSTEAPSNPVSRYSPHALWTIDPSGRWIGGHSVRYEIIVGWRGVNPIQVQRRVKQVALTRDEAATTKASLQVPGRTGPVSVPRFKPYFQDVFVDLDSRVWVRVPNHFRRKPRGGSGVGYPDAEWVEDATFDVFRQDGTYLGVVVLPPGSGFVEATKSRVWVTNKGNSGETYVLRYRLSGGKE